MDDIINNKVTIVIPTYNSERTINNTLNILTKIFKNIIVVDGQSKDLTRKICNKYNTKLFTLKNNNRGIQLNLGSKKVFTNWILFLHADSILENTAIEEIEKFISSDENKYKAATFKLKFDQVNIYAFLLSKVVTFRSKYFKLPYGDQGLLISKAFYNKIGGYKNLPIMEDVEIIRNVGFRNIKILNSYIITDSIRYKSAGWLIRPFINLYCLTLYLLGFNIKIINKIYTRKTYGKN
ncbi:MAG: glycosyltransferase [Pelagibacterales bacterium]|nr:glycosyltransferase [Pelagibacterales bacterium]